MDSVHGDAQSVWTTYRASIPELMREHRIPGLSIAVVDPDRILWTAGFGHTDGDQQTPVTPDTRFAIQSITKSVTATAVMLAVQEGLVDLEVPIVNYLPSFAVHSRYEEHPERRITMRHLLNCTAGFAHEAPVGNNNDSRFPSFEAHVQSISDTWLRHPVGSGFSYSNLGFDVAASLLQVVAGMPFSEFLSRKVFDPLGMRNSSVDMEVIRKDRQRAVGHKRYFRKIPVEIPMVGAGGIYASAKDMARFMQFHLNRGAVGGRRLLDGRSLDAMYAVSPASGDYALGFAIGRKHDSYLVNHNGGGFGFLGSMTFYPEYGIGCVVLTNSEDHVDEQVKLVHRVLDSLIIGGLVSRSESRGFPSVADVLPPAAGEASRKTTSGAFDTPYRPEFSGYTGNYRYILGGWEPALYVRLAFALGYAGSGSSIAVHEHEGYLCVGDERLEEYQAGLFFTASGEALDMRGATPTWQNCALRKIE